MLWSDNLSLTSNLDLESHLLVFEGNNLVRCVLLFNGKLFNTLDVQTNETSKELESVLEVLLLLVHCGITDKSFLICVSDDHPK